MKRVAPDRTGQVWENNGLLYAVTGAPSAPDCDFVLGYHPTVRLQDAHVGHLRELAGQTLEDEAATWPSFKRVL